MSTEEMKLGETLGRFENPAIGCSFGIDSLVALHLCLKARPDILVVWNNTLVEYPDTVKFARRLAKEWNLNVVETKPRKTFWEIVERYGFPLVRRGDSRDRKAVSNGAVLRYSEEVSHEKGDQDEKS